MTVKKVISLATPFLVLLIALGSFVLSYHNLRLVAIENGISDNLSFIWPLLIDASMVVFSLAVVYAYLHSESTWRQWALVGLYTGATIGFNVIHAPDNFKAQIVAAIAPISLFFSFEILMSQLKNGVKRSELIKSIKQLELDSRKKRDDLTTSLEQERLTLQAGLTEDREKISKEIDKKRQELDSLLKQIDQTVKRLNNLNEQAESVKSNQILQAKQIQLDTANSERQTRLTNLIEVLRLNSQVGVSSLAEQFEVSRQTIYNDLSTLEQEGILHKNGNGYEVLA